MQTVLLQYPECSVRTKQLVSNWGSARLILKTGQVAGHMHYKHHLSDCLAPQASAIFSALPFNPVCREVNTRLTISPVH